MNTRRAFHPSSNHLVSKQARAGKLRAMWAYGRPSVSIVLQGATVLCFSNSLSRLVLLSRVEIYLAVCTALHYESMRKPETYQRTIMSSLSAFMMCMFVALYLPMCLLAVIAYLIELAVQCLIPLVTLGMVSNTSLHRSFAQVYEVLDHTGLFPMQYLETEAVGVIKSDMYEACVRERQWSGCWPLYYLELDPCEETELEMILEPFVRASSLTSGMGCTVMKAGLLLVQIGGLRFCKKLSIADSIGCTLVQEEQKISYTLGRMYDPDSPFYRVNTISLTGSLRVGADDCNVSAFSDGKTSAKMVYYTQDYTCAFQELSDQIEEYPLTIDICHSDGVDVVRSNIMLVKHLVGLTASAVAASWFGIGTILSEKDVEKSAYVLAVYALWVSLGYVPVFGKDIVSFSDLLVSKRRRIIEALLRSKCFLSKDRHASSWNFRQSHGLKAIARLGKEEAVLTARICTQSNNFAIALDSCSLRSFSTESTVSRSGADTLFVPGIWTIARREVRTWGTSCKIGSEPEQ